MFGDGNGRQPTIRDLVFVHIPKTAGTSLRNSLAAALTDSVKIFCYPDTSSVQGDFIHAFTEGVTTPEAVLALRRKFDRNQHLFVCGHISARPYLGAFHPGSFIAFLRDPVERVISAYQHHRRHMDFKGSLSEFYEQPGHINVQSQMLWGIDLRDIGFVGLTEMMPEMFEALSRHLDVPLKGRRDNVGRRFGGPSVSESDRSRIMALNDIDVQLYRHVKANLGHFTNYRSRNREGLALARGKVRRADNNEIVGWAAGFHTGKLAEIEVRTGPEVIHRCYADQFLPRLRHSHLAPHGVGGFQVPLPERLPAGTTEIRVVFAGTDKDLIGSPIPLATA